MTNIQTTLVQDRGAQLRQAEAALEQAESHTTMLKASVMLAYWNLLLEHNDPLVRHAARALEEEHATLVATLNARG